MRRTNRIKEYRLVYTRYDKPWIFLDTGAAGQGIENPPMLAAIFFITAAALLMAALMLSCAQSPRAVESAVPAASISPAEPPAATATPPENMLNGPAFKNIPGEAKDYLERLSRAFLFQDESFLLAQGESQFEAEIRPRYDKEIYLALLYRIGVYAADSPRVGGQPLRLTPAAIRHIQYLSWKENGPLLEIKARLIDKNGTTTPCLIMLIWRLREPKIEGLFL
ncbi:MAG: hypothetical protein LBK62_08220 [Treponema sp.]|jgi:hypothetical protein|nr:hypothetical protein [Treponema sp.]